MTNASTLRRLAVLAVVTTSILAAIVFHDIVGAAKPVAVTPLPSVHARLASHVVLVVVDGLRYDYAIDGTRAPTFARHMHDDTHAELWAGRITMSSSAILSMGTGQRGDLTQVVFNLDMARSPYNDLFTNARAAGRRLALAGNPVWAQAFGEYDDQVLDRSKIALEVDNTDEVFAAGEKLALTEPRPDFLIVHFDAADHQSHAYGAGSDRYRAFLRRFDARLETFLQQLPADTTVIGLSDHGALDSGAHGADSVAERRSPFFAYGPGIRPGLALAPLDQIDLAETFAALLGVPAPTHGRGLVIAELLDVEPVAAAAIACGDARRVLAVAAA
ncbi:MAG: alkaline phosphatase family protein, partial [Polyangiales bacterium]